ncbi:MAG: ABC transporter ATP-binding protein [Planctomycetota bacterium]|jgi:iron complex transport system ATP-binding protein
MEPLELRGVTVRYGARAVLESIDLHVPHGQRAALVGPNGSGKTTLLRVLAGILRADEGAVVPAGSLPRREIALQIAYLPQEEHWEFPFSVEEVVRCGRYARMSTLYRETGEDREAVERGLNAVGLAELRARPITELSGGERRRAVLARVLAQEAAALLLDEPTTALDLEHRHAVLRAVASNPGTVLFATHDLDAAAAYAERVVILDKGRVVADGAPGEVITEERIETVFRVRARVVREEGRIHVVPEI